MGIMKKKSSQVNHFPYHVRVKTTLLALSSSVLLHSALPWFPCFPRSRRHMTATTTKAVVAAPDSARGHAALPMQRSGSLLLPLTPPPLLVPLTFLSISLSLSLSPSLSLILSQLTDT